MMLFSIGVLLWLSGPNVWKETHCSQVFFLIIDEISVNAWLKRILQICNLAVFNMSLLINLIMKQGFIIANN